MFSQNKITDFFVRMGIGIVIGCLFGWVLSSFGSFFVTEVDTGTRDPEQVELVIPYGTADNLAAGAPVREIPSSLRFVQGDILVVRNEDKVAHQLGPLFVPPNTSSVLNLDEATIYSYECSFEPSKNIGLTVLPRITASTRINAILAIGLPTGMMLAVYSYMWDGKKKKNAVLDAPGAPGPGESKTV